MLSSIHPHHLPVELIFKGTFLRLANRIPVAKVRADIVLVLFPLKRAVHDRVHHHAAVRKNHRAKKQETLFHGGVGEWS